MALNFPNSPTIGDEFTGGGFTWTWTGNAWEKVAASGALLNTFTLITSANNSYSLDRVYPAGRYAITISNADTTFDIYAIAENDSLAGYTKTSSLVATNDFDQVVLLGVSSGHELVFEYQGTANSPSASGNIVSAGAYINSVVTASLPNINDTTVINGGNFASNVEVVFIGQNLSETTAKTVVRSSSTQLLVTRPDSFSISNSPYSVKVTNPGVTVPSGSNAHILSNAVSAGTLPSWITGNSINYNISHPTSITLLASDTEASDVDYTVVSGTLPAGLTLNNETGVISGTFSGSASEGDSTSITFRATDAGGNFADKAISLIANASPVWSTAAGALANGTSGSAYSVQLSASTGSAGGSLTYSLQSGSLPTGLSISSSGLISGTASGGGSSSFTIRVTDQLNAFTDRAFSITVTPGVAPEYLVVAGGGGGGRGGGGAGGYRSGTLSGLITSTNYAVTVGAGGGVTDETGGNSIGIKGSNSTFHTITSTGGGFGGPITSNGGPGGSGGGAGWGQGSGTGGTGNQGGFSPSEGNNGGSGDGGGGGGAGAAGSSRDAGAGLNSSITGTSVGRAGGGGCGANYSNGHNLNSAAFGGGAGGRNTGGGSNGVANTGGGGGGQGGAQNVGYNGGSGVVILRYPNTRTITVGAGLTASVTNQAVGTNERVTVITAGTGNVSWS